MPRLAALPLTVLLACARADEAEPAGADAQALQAATAELAAARAAWEADRAATTKELAELRKAVDETNAKLATLAAERSPPIPVPGPVDPYYVPPEAEALPMSVDPGVATPDETLAAFVRCETESRCKVEKAWFEAMMVNPAALAKQARLVPKLEGEKTLGIKLYGIRRGSLPKALELKNGDLVKSINGYPMGSMEKMLEAFTKLRRATTFTLEIERKGVSLTHTVEIVEHL